MARTAKPAAAVEAPLACPRFVGTNEQHRELLAPWREENDIDGECRTPLTWSCGCGLRTFAHHARISHERRLMSRPRENCHESTPTAMRLSRAPIVGPTRDSVNVPLRCARQRVQLITQRHIHSR